MHSTHLHSNEKSLNLENLLFLRYLPDHYRSLCLMSLHEFHVECELWIEMNKYDLRSF